MARKWLLCIVAVALVSLLAPAAHAHSMYQSSVLLDMRSRAIDVELQLPPSRLSDAMGRGITPSQLQQETPAIDAYITQHMAIADDRGHLWPIGLQEQPEWIVVEGAPYVRVLLHVVPPEGASTRHFLLTDRIIAGQLTSHSILVTVRSDWASGVFATEPSLVGIIDSTEPQLEVQLEQGSWTRGFRSVFKLGVRHIAEGTDHLLFLLALLLPAPLAWHARRWSRPLGIRQSLWRIVAIATAFTVGHSLTLALASLGVVHVSSRPVETLIAISILISAVHAVRPLFPGRESVIACGFGLVHGLAFAGTLTGLGLHGVEQAESLLAFNLGIEAMQLVVILCVLPSLLLLSRTSAYTGFRVGSACLAGAAAVGWIAERWSGQSFGVDRAVASLASKPIPLAGSLLLVAVVVFLLRRQRSSQALARE